ncbi:MAG: hypothetical protein ACOYEB_04320 [Enterococcus lemanii]|jgi:putative aldouronate transport system substrate-binding protein
MPTIINSGENYDIAFASNFTADPQKGAFADLSELAPKYAKEYLDQLPDMYIDGNAWSQQRLTFNQQYLEKHKIDVSKVDGSYASATEVMREFHKKEPNITAFAIGQSFRASGNYDYPFTATSLR